MVAGIAMQAARGYYHFEIPLYLESLLGFRFIDYLLIAVLAMTMHVIVNHKYLGHFLVILVYVGIGLLGASRTRAQPLSVRLDAGSTYSDMNGWGPYVVAVRLVEALLGRVRRAAARRCRPVLGARRGDEIRGADPPGAPARSDAGRGAAAARRRRRSPRSAGSSSIIPTSSTSTGRARPSGICAPSASGCTSGSTHAPQPRIAGVTDPGRPLPVERRRRGHRPVPAPQQDQRRRSTRSTSASTRSSTSAGSTSTAATRVLDDRPRNYHIYRLARPLAPGDTMRHALRPRPDHARLSERDHTTRRRGNGTFLENASSCRRSDTMRAARSQTTTRARRSSCRRAHACGRRPTRRRGRRTTSVTTPTGSPTTRP